MTDITFKTLEKTQMPARWPGEMAVILRLGIPMALTQLVQFSVYTVDVIMLGRIGAADLAAAALGSVVYFALWMLASGPVMAVTPLVSQALGANKHERHDVRISMRMTLWIVFMMLPIILALVLLTEPAALALGQDPEISRKAAQYVLALAAGAPFAMAVMAMRNFFAALEKTIIPFVLVAMGTLMNIFLNWILIFGELGFPRLELIGAGIASSLAYAFSFALFVAYAFIDPKARTFRLFKRFWRPRWARFREVLHLGWPMSLTTFFEGMLFNAAVVIMGVIGVAEQAAYQVALNVVALAFMLPFGMSMAGSVRIGLAAGAENRPAMLRVTWISLFTCVAIILGFAATVLFFPAEIAHFYLDETKPGNPAVIALVTGFLPLAAAFMFFDAVQLTANQLLRGLKDVRWPMVAAGISYWVIGFPIAIGLALFSPIGANGVWYGLMAGLAMASILLSWRLRRMLTQVDMAELAAQVEEDEHEVI